MVRAMSTLAPVRPHAVLADAVAVGRLPELATGDLYAVMVARQEVFAVEQRCAFLDADGLDAQAFHLLGWDEHGAAPFWRATCASSIPGRNSPNRRSAGC